MKLEDLDLSRCLYDPRKPSILNDTKHIPEFAQDMPYKMPKKKVITFIVLMYDKDSPLWREVRNLPARKGVAIELAGFKTDNKGRFERNIELLLEGKNQVVNSMIVRYIALQNSPKWGQLVGYEALYYMEFAKIQNGAYGKANDIIKSLDTLSKAIDQLTEDIVGGKGEAEPILSLIYKEVTKDIDLSPERISDYIMSEEGNVPADWCPYNEWKDDEIQSEYKVEKPKFVGAE